jgi:pyruvate/2-oxoglutarate dehydrogenase complex dihydrolipoamide acyltransferase (E2) component
MQTLLALPRALAACAPCKCARLMRACTSPAQHVLLPIALLLSLSLPSSSENGGAHSDSRSCSSRGNCAGADEQPGDQPQTSHHASPPPPPSPRQHRQARAAEALGEANVRHARSDEADGSGEDKRRRLREERQRRDERIKVEIHRQQREAEAAAGAQAFQSASAADEHLRARQRVILSWASRVLLLLNLNPKRPPALPLSTNRLWAGNFRVKRSRGCSRSWSTISAAGKLPSLRDRVGFPAAPLQARVLKRPLYIEFT